METNPKKEENVPIWKNKFIIICVLVGIPLMAGIVYVSLIFNFSPMTNALIGAVIASVLGFIAPRPTQDKH